MFIHTFIHIIGANKTVDNTCRMEMLIYVHQGIEGEPKKKKTNVRMDNSFGARPKVEQGHGQRLPHEHWREYFGFFPFDLQSSFSPELTTLDCVAVFSFSHFPTISKLYAAFARSSCFCFAHDVWT